MAIVAIVEFALAHLVIYYAYCLYRNLQYARRTGLRVVISPITPFSWPWQVTNALLRKRVQHLRWFRAIDWTAAWQDDDKLHRELGHNFWLVSPGFNVLCTNDVRLSEAVYRNWRDFVKPDNVNGPNKSNGDDWLRHRKITAPCFSERASSLVWAKGIQQSDKLVAEWLSSPKREKNNTAVDDLQSLTLHVVSSIAFDRYENTEPTEGHTISLKESIVTIMSSTISPLLSPLVPLFTAPGLRWLLPPSIKKLLVAMQELRQYMEDDVSRERQKPASQHDNGWPNLITTLIRANDASSSPKLRLSHQEVRGNIFVFIVGGQETSAVTLGFALALLALSPDVQDWIVEELEEVLQAADFADYPKVFPKLKRIMAVMYETLRVWGPAPPIPRAPRVQGLQLPTSSTPPSTLTLPPNSQLMLNSWASHASELNYPSPKTFDPKRWIQPGPTLAEDKLLHPASESGFLAWGAGPRICPGMKFSQVEFTAVLASLLKRAKVGVVSDGRPGSEEEEEAKKRLMSVMLDSQAEPLVLKMRRPEDLWLRFEARC